MPGAKPKRKTSDDPRAARLARLRDAMQARGVHTLMVSDPSDVAYLTGFLGGDSYLVVPPSGKPTILSDARYEEDLEAFKPIATIRMRRGTMFDAVADALSLGGFTGGRAKRTLGVQGEHLTLSAHVALRSALKKEKIPAGAITTVSGIVGSLREIKDETEIRLLRKAISIQERALEETLPTIEPGQTELEICAELEYQMKALGSTDPSFATIVGAKGSSAKPHYTPAKIKTARGKPLLIDWGATHQGYHGDMTRTFSLGSWTKKMAEIYDVVAEAHELAAAALRPGALAREIDRVARDHIARAGYGREFGHGLGHGIGLDVHEGPRVSKLAGETVLTPGHVVTIEPGIYLPGIGGVRLEDDYAITERGAKNLCTLPRTREWATL